jgi:hypothetical protein
MAKRDARQSSSPKTSPKDAMRVAHSDTLRELEQQVIGIATQLGRLAGAAQAKADRWFSQPAFQSQLAQIRNRASALLSRLNSNGGSASDDRRTGVRERSREKVAAPGKKHRKAPGKSRTIKSSSEQTTKAIAARRRTIVRPRQG